MYFRKFPLFPVLHRNAYKFQNDASFDPCILQACPNLKVVLRYNPTGIFRGRDIHKGKT